MQNPIPISVDDRRFSIWNWLGFVAGFTFITLHFAGMATGILAAIWETVWVDDFNDTDLAWAVGGTIFGVLGFLAFYSVFYWGLGQEPFAHKSILLDTRSGRLILEWRHITGLSRRKSLSLSDILDVNVTWNRDEDGKDVPQLVLIPKGKPVHPIITNPTEAADLPAFAARLRTELAAVGWSDGSACGCPQGEAASGRC